MSEQTLLGLVSRRFKHPSKTSNPSRLVKLKRPFPIEIAVQKSRLKNKFDMTQVLLCQLDFDDLAIKLAA